MQAFAGSSPIESDYDVDRLYAERLATYEDRSAKLDKVDDRIALCRFMAAAGVAAAIYLYVVQQPLAVPVGLFFLAAFAALSIYHVRVADRLQRAKRLSVFYKAGLRRIRGDWPGTGNPGDRFVTLDHLYSRDLDLFGSGSLFELLCLARTRAGEDRLAALLTFPVDAETARRRQEASRELAPRLDLREEIALLGREFRSGIDPDRLAIWARRPRQDPSKPVRLLAVAITAATVATGIGWAAHMIPYFWFVAAFAAGRLYERSISGRLQAIVKSIRRTSLEFEIIGSIAARIEREHFECGELRTIASEFVRDGKPASARINQLSQITGLLDSTANLAIALLSPLLLWTSHCAFAVEKWRVDHGVDVTRWNDAIGSIEAYLSIASYAFEHPDQPYPEIIGAEAALYFDAAQIAHPLIAAGKVVRNDIRIDQSARLFIVSGSNMSGKSTLLRTIGVNAVLAMAGAPVCAKQLAIQPRAIGTSITTNDSLQGGVSRFYAEIYRLRQIVDLAAERPTLFLVDEILHGTNSHDRAIGSEAILRKLVQSNAVGLATTHDLAISAIAGDPALYAVNVHFEDQLVDGRMSFDYKLRNGVVTKSNALDLMRAVGLDIRGDLSGEPQG